jgi:small-conductance mechanosensitive channel
MRYSVPVVGIGILAEIFGYSELADRVIILVIWGPVAGASFIAIVRIIEAILQSYIDAGHFDFLKMIRVNRHPFVTLTRRIIRAFGFFAWAFLILRITQIFEPVRDVLYSILTTQLGVAPVKFSLGGIFAFGFTLWFTWLLSRFINLILDNEIFPRIQTPPGVPLAITTFTRYTILVVGFLAAVSVLGFPLDKITLVLGALGVGIGFGLQNITNNFVSGIILLFERPIRVGDKIQLDDLIGRVTSIGIRASKITSFEGSDVIVPNADFISSRVINWTFSDEKRRVIIPVGVAHGSDPEQVLELLLKIAQNHSEIIDNPKPEALFQNFGESSLDFELRAWTESNRGWIAVKSDLAVAIHKALQEANIEIPFPQRDVNLRNIPELQDALVGVIKK